MPAVGYTRSSSRRRMAHQPVHQAFTAALDGLISQVKKDRGVVAALLCGSLSHDTVWARSDIDLVLVTIDDKDVKRGSISLNADGVNVHAFLLPRTDFRRMVEGSVQNSFMHSLLVKGRLLYTHDDTITTLCQGLAELGARDREIQLLRAATYALPAVYKAHKWLVTRGDLDYTALWILYAATPLAEMEVVGAGLVAGREVIPQALERNPAFFRVVYTDLLNRPRRARASKRRSPRWTSISRRAPQRVRPGARLPAPRRRGALLLGDREPLQAQPRRRAGDDGVRVPGRSGFDRQGVDTGAAHQEEQRGRPGARVRPSRRRSAVRRRVDAGIGTLPASASRFPPAV